MINIIIYGRIILVLVDFGKNLPWTHDFPFF